MLIDVHYIRCVDYETRRYEFELTDSEFVALSSPSRHIAAPGNGVDAVIAEYSKRQLNVAANLARLFVICRERYGLSCQQVIEEWVQFEPGLMPYQAELDKYLALV